MLPTLPSRGHAGLHRSARSPLPLAPIAPLALLLAAAAPVALSAQGATLPGHFEIVSLPDTYTLPVGLTFAPDGGVFVLEKPGTVRVLDPSGVQRPLPFIDLVAEVNNDWDRGLLGVALHPGFVPDGGPTSWVYLLYTVSPVPPNDNGFNQDNKYSFSRLTRWRATTSGASILADLASRQVLLGNQLADGSVPDGIASIHNSHSNGTLRFADDGSLLLSTGDGAHYDFQDNGGADTAGFDTFTHPVTGKKGPTPKVQDEGAFRAQDPRSLSGKVLRIDPATGLGYPSNPFYDGDPTSNRSKVWALGLRNPFRMDLVPGTGAANPALGQPNVVVLGDVGYNLWEELNVARFPGTNFGWPCWEGTLVQGGYQAYSSGDPNKVTCKTAVTGTITPPVLSWHHSNAGAYKPAGVYVDEGGNPLPGFKGNCAIGGPIYTGGAYPAQYVGRMFFADYGQQYIKTVQFDAAWNVVAVRDFAGQSGQVVDIERHPLTGDLWFTNLTNNRVQILQYGANLTPIAVATGAPLLGDVPLAVQFDGSASHDPDGDPLGYDWDFGDGSAHSAAANPLHTYTADGLYDAVLTVSDGLGLSGQDGLLVAVGNAPPTAAILSPADGALYTSPTTLQFSGAGSDPDGDPLSYAWSVDLYHGTHVHPGIFGAAGAQAAFPIGTSPEDDELLYYRVNLSVTDGGGLSGSAHAWVYPSAGARDVAGSALPIARVMELAPPEPTGGGNHDVEVVRDAVTPVVGSTSSAQQYDTYHGGGQGNDDWIGYAFAAPPSDEFRFTRVVFQEGKHFVDGGWWKDLRVEVRDGGTWSSVPGVQIDPAYPFALSGQPFFDGLNFQSYTLRFDPVHGDAIRLRGSPGGTAGFVSAGELRAYAVAAPPSDGYRDITAQGAVIAKLFSMFPPNPLGSGNQDPGTIKNGTTPPVGSTSWLAQYDTFHSNQQGSEDWIGYDFGGLRTFSRVRFQEGRNNADGGAFDAFTVQVAPGPGGPWADVPGVTSTPAYDGLDGVNYETFVLTFPPVSGRALRLHGDPAGSNGFLSVAELGVDTPDPGDGCGWLAYGEPGGANQLVLASETPPLLGLPIEITGGGAVGPAAGWLLLGFGDAALPFKGGALLVAPQPSLLIGVVWNAAGTLLLASSLPADPQLEGLSVWLQAFALGQPGPYTIRMSNGLRMTLCSG